MNLYKSNVNYLIYIGQKQPSGQPTTNRINITCILGNRFFKSVRKLAGHFLLSLRLGLPGILDEDKPRTRVLELVMSLERKDLYLMEARSLSKITFSSLW